jgi:hypothetical protein
MMPDDRTEQNARRADYLAKAAEARKTAERASDPLQRAQWEQIASVWDYIAKHALPDPSAG